MRAESGEGGGERQWGPVRRGFRVSLPSGERGSVEAIRVGADGVELVVATGLFVRRFVTIPAAEVEAILPTARRVIVTDPNAVTDVEAAGGEPVGVAARGTDRIPG